VKLIIVGLLLVVLTACGSYGGTTSVPSTPSTFTWNEACGPWNNPASISGWAGFDPRPVGQPGVPTRYCTNPAVVCGGGVVLYIAQLIDKQVYEWRDLCGVTRAAVIHFSNQSDAVFGEIPPGCCDSRN
jgi:hypothetical protein